MLNKKQKHIKKYVNSKMNQQQLFRQEKLASIGQLSAGIAHEINNPLGFINSNLETAKVYINDFKEIMTAYKRIIELVESNDIQKLDYKIKQLKAMEKEKDIEFLSEDIEAICDDMEDGLGRISEIVSSLRAFSRKNNNIFEEYNLNNGIKNTIIISENDYKYNAKIVENLGHIPNIQANGNKIDQVLLNIILNASAAIKEKQVINNHAEEGVITITTDYNCGYVSCIVEDNGIGIEEKNINKLFDPFFTTKPVGEGTGLGLSIAYEMVVTQHKGNIHIESKPMVGSKFTILLPIKQNNISGENKK